MTNSKQKFIDEWTVLEFQNCPFFIAQKLGETFVKERVNLILSESYEYATNLTLAQKNHDYCQVKGASPKDYLYRELTTPLGKMITSIRFLGGDLSKPFVLIVHKNFDVKNISDIWQINAILSKEYALFKPKKVSWFSPKIETTLIENNSFLSGDMVYVAEFIDVLQQKKLPKNTDIVKLKLAKNTKWFSKYEQEYINLFKVNPAFVEMAQITNEATFKEMIKQQLLYEIFVDNKWAGIIGVQAQADYFFSGYCVYEELLCQQFRGKQLAPAVQSLLIKNLPANENKVIYGTIHHDNIPSLKTALRVGRNVCGMNILAKL